MIKVIIERQIADGMESTYDDAIKKTLSAMISAHGYVSGATYKDADDDNHRIIIRNWTSIDAWKKWHMSSDRSDAIAAIKPILKDQEKFTVLTA